MSASSESTSPVGASATIRPCRSRPSLVPAARCGVSSTRGAERKEALGRAGAMLARLNLPERLWQLPPATFSGGEQQMLAIGRAIWPARRAGAPSRDRGLSWSARWDRQRLPWRPVRAAASP